MKKLILLSALLCLQTAAVYADTAFDAFIQQRIDVTLGGLSADKSDPAQCRAECRAEVQQCRAEGRPLYECASEFGDCLELCTL